MLEGPNLLVIAAKMFGKSIITDVEYDMVSDPSSDHATTITNTVLKAVRKAIVNNPSVFDDLKGILIDMGPPITSLARELGMTSIAYFF